MKIIFILALMIVAGLSGYVIAEDSTSQNTTTAVNVGNKICPVSGEGMMEGQETTVEYKGKIYNLCCSMCKKDFLKNPEKYIKALKDKGDIK